MAESDRTTRDPGRRTGDAITRGIEIGKAGLRIGNIEIERQTQVFVDTVRAAIDERLGPLLPALEALLRQQGASVDDLARPAALPRT